VCVRKGGSGGEGKAVGRCSLQLVFEQPIHQHPQTSTYTPAPTHQHPHTSTHTPAPTHQHPNANPHSMQHHQNAQDGTTVTVQGDAPPPAELPPTEEDLQAAEAAVAVQAAAVRVLKEETGLTNKVRSRPRRASRFCCLAD